MEPVRLGVVRYLNTAPLIEGLDRVEGLSIVPAVPAKMIDMLIRGEVDIALASIVDAVRSPEPMTILPVGMIGCDGPTLTVRVFSAVPLDEIEEIHADTDSHTSVILSQLMIRARTGRRPRVIPFDARERVALTDPARAEEWPRTVLLIGDKVVTESLPAVRYPHQMDLGEEWHARTGLPFVYAAWMTPTSRVEEPRIQTAAALLDRQRRHNATRLDWIVSRRAAAHRWPEDLAREYLGTRLRYELGVREREGAERFIAEAADAELLPHGPLAWDAPAYA